MKDDRSIDGAAAAIIWGEGVEERKKTRKSLKKKIYKKSYKKIDSSIRARPSSDFECYVAIYIGSR